MLILKLLLVPAFLGLISLAGKRWGPGFAGWLAGLPVVVGPILCLLAIEQGAAFARQAAVYTLGAVFPVIIFGATYAHACHRLGWPLALAAAYLAWLAAAALLLALPLSIALAAGVAIVILLIAPQLFPAQADSPPPVHLPHHELALRMAAGAALTLLVTTLAAMAGTRLSGLLALFPVLSAILAVFAQRSGGAAAAIALLAALARGLSSLAAFCLTLALLLETAGIATAFAAAAAVALAVQSSLPSPRRH